MAVDAGDRRYYHRRYRDADLSRRSRNDGAVACLFGAAMKLASRYDPYPEDKDRGIPFVCRPVKHIASRHPDGRTVVEPDGTTWEAAVVPTSIHPNGLICIYHAI